MDLSHLSAAQLRELRPNVGAVLQERIDARLAQLAPEILDVPGRPKTEARIRAECKDWCVERDATLVIDTEQNRPTRVTPGLSDLIVFWPDRRGVWFVECKAADGKQSIDQVKFQRACEAAGVPYVLAYSTADLEAYARERAA